jgi:polysaccharide biosynthesis/export protein
MRNSIGGRGLVLIALLAGCANLGPYVWVDEVGDTAPPPGSEYTLAPGDAIFIRVFNQESVSGRTRVRPDGRITVPFVNDIPAAGRTPQQVAKTVESMLRGFINQPVVTVALEEPAQTHFSVLGEVARPGAYSVERGQGMLRALAAAGGLTDFAHKDRIFVMRGSPQQRIRFSFDALSTPNSPAARFRLQDQDVVVVQ